jgi:hypothetical protein
LNRGQCKSAITDCKFWMTSGTNRVTNGTFCHFAYAFQMKCFCIVSRTFGDLIYLKASKESPVRGMPFNHSKA